MNDACQPYGSALASRVADEAGHRRASGVERSGQVLSSLTTGAGVDNIDSVAGTHTVLVASRKTALLSAVEVSAKGKAKVKATYPTALGSRTVLTSSPQAAWLPDSKGHRVVPSSWHLRAAAPRIREPDIWSTFAWCSGVWDACVDGEARAIREIVDEKAKPGSHGSRSRTWASSGAARDEAPSIT